MNPHHPNDNSEKKVNFFHLKKKTLLVYENFTKSAQENTITTIDSHYKKAYYMV